jgi:hypothetical protein
MWFAFALLILLLLLGIKTVMDQRRDLADLKQLVSEISARQDRLERQVARRPIRMDSPVQRADKMWSLADGTIVDKHGIIWQGNKAVGRWGFDEPKEQRQPMPVERSDVIIEITPPDKLELMPDKKQ